MSSIWATIPYWRLFFFLLWLQLSCIRRRTNPFNSLINGLSRIIIIQREYIFNSCCISKLSKCKEDEEKRIYCVLVYLSCLNHPPYWICFARLRGWLTTEPYVSWETFFCSMPSCLINDPCKDCRNKGKECSEFPVQTKNNWIKQLKSQPLIGPKPFIFSVIF